MIKAEWDMGRMLNNENDSNEPEKRSKKKQNTNKTFVILHSSKENLEVIENATMKTEESNDTTQKTRLKNIINC